MATDDRTEAGRRAFKPRRTYPEPNVAEGRLPTTATAARAMTEALWAHAEEYSPFRGPIALGGRAWLASRCDVDIAPPTEHDARIPQGYHLLTGDLDGESRRESADSRDGAIEILTRYLSGRRPQ